MDSDIIKEQPYIEKLIAVVKNEMRKTPRKTFVDGRLSDAFVYILTGSCEYRFTDGTNFIVESGDLLYLASGAVYEMNLKTEIYGFIYVDFHFNDEKRRASAVHKKDNERDFCTLFKKLYQEYRNHTAQTKLRCIRQLYDIYALICEQTERAYIPSSMKELMERCKNCIDSQHRNPALSIADLAREAGMSEVYFRKAFKAAYKLQPKKYLTAVRLKNARQWMQYSFLSLNECAALSGFSTWQYFSKVFKNETGETPASYRKKRYGQTETTQRKIEIFADCLCGLSESPVWDAQKKVLYWRGSDGEIYRKALASSVRDYEKFELAIGHIGSIVLTDTEYLLLFCDHGKIWKWKPYETPILYKDYRLSLFNDVLCDGHGRIYCGMLAENYFDAKKRGKHGALLLFDKNGLIRLDNTLSPTPNGIRISPSEDKLYFAVTDDGCVYAYDYDAETGALSNRKIFAENCCPDGIAMDEAGNLWVANCDPSNSSLDCYAPDGRLLERLRLPVRRIISVAFGGDDGKMLFITTANENQPRSKHDGGVFFLRTDIRGAREYRFPLKTND